MCPGSSFEHFCNIFSYEDGPFVCPDRVSVISAGVFPPGMVRLCSLFRGFPLFRYVIFRGWSLWIAWYGLPLIQ